MKHFSVDISDHAAARDRGTKEMNEHEIDALEIHRTGPKFPLIPGFKLGRPHPSAIGFVFVNISFSSPLFHTEQKKSKFPGLSSPITELLHRIKERAFFCNRVEERPSALRRRTRTCRWQRRGPSVRNCTCFFCSPKRCPTLKVQVR